MRSGFRCLLRAPHAVSFGQDGDGVLSKEELHAAPWQLPGSGAARWQLPEIDGEVESTREWQVTAVDRCLSWPCSSVACGP